MLDPRKYGFFAIQLISHKLLKWLVPVFMVTALVSNIALYSIEKTQIYNVLLPLQFCFYMCAVKAAQWGEDRPSWLTIILFFVESNLAIAKAWVSYLRGQRFVTWETSVR
jgi:hypothetical protein